MLGTRATRVACATALLSVAVGCATQTASRPAGTPQSAAPASVVQDPDADEGPPDGRWLRDAEGHEYYALPVAMPPGTYQWLDPGKTRARIRHGLEVEVLAHDDEGLTIKVYRTDDDPPPRPPGPSAADRERVAATYRASATPGDGVRLVPIEEGLPRRGQWRNGFAVADVNGDGHRDVAFGPPRKSRRPPSVFLGDGTGRWTVWQEARFPALPFDYGDAAVGDLNGDGRADVVLASHLRGIVATVGDGRGGFTAWSEGIEFGLPGEARGSVFTSRAITLADWNRDGRPDVVALGEGPRLTMAPARTEVDRGSRGVVVYLNDGDGTWTKRVAPGSGNFGDSVAVGDLSGDGLPDIVTGSARRGFRGLLNVGTPDGGSREVEIPELRPNALFPAVALADFDRDGRLDLAVTFLGTELDTDRRGIDVLLARGTGFARTTLVAEESRAALGALAAGDVDADGAPDLVAVDELGRILLLRGDGHGSFSNEPASMPAGSEACRGYALRLADVDAVRGDDVVVSFADEGDESPFAGEPKCPSQGSLRVFRVSSD